jgi:hypothetical protein
MGTPTYWGSFFFSRWPTSQTGVSASFCLLALSSLQSLPATLCRYRGLRGLIVSPAEPLPDWPMTANDGGNSPSVTGSPRILYILCALLLKIAPRWEAEEKTEGERDGFCRRIP